MEIYVLVKQVPDPEAMIKVKSDSELEIENKYFTNFFDEIAIEAGMKLKEKFGGKVTVLTVDNRKVDALRRGISMGADEAIQITNPAVKSLIPFADKICLSDNSIFTLYTSDAYLAAMAPLVKEYQPSILLGGATSTGKDLFPRLAMA